MVIYHKLFIFLKSYSEDVQVFFQSSCVLVKLIKKLLDTSPNVFDHFAGHLRGCFRSFVADPFIVTWSLYALEIICGIQPNMFI